MFASVAKKRELPDTLSGLLRVAVEDSQEIEATEGYELHMGKWYQTNGVCQVCMAGAVMLRSGAFSPKANVCSSEQFEAVITDKDLRRKMRIIDSLRSGLMATALHLTSGTTPDFSLSEVYDIGRTIWMNLDHDIGRAPWPVYIIAAEALEKAGF